MRQCNTAEELVHLAHDHLDTISPRGMAAFWSSLVKHVQNHGRGDSRVQLNEQLAKILCNTLENMKGYSYRDITTVAISLAKIMKQVESRGQRAATNSLHCILHDLLIGGGNSEKKRCILNEIACHTHPFQV
jgi:DNA-directed RNA polymerase specialized sigma54-like protein